MGRQQKDTTFDLDLILKDAGAVTSSAAAQVDSAAKVVNLGNARFDGRVIVDVSAIEVGTDEVYGIEFQLLNEDADEVGFITSITLGKASDANLENDSGPGRYELAVTNEQDGTIWPKARLFTRMAGDSTSINYKAHLAKATT